MAWKQEVEQKTATQSLRLKLVTMTWNQQTKQVQVTQKTPISMTSMQSLLEELTELIRDPAAVVRLKSLKASQRRQFGEGDHLAHQEGGDHWVAHGRQIEQCPE